VQRREGGCSQEQCGETAHVFSPHFDDALMIAIVAQANADSTGGHVAPTE
jgi:hypothetical protein